MKFEAKPLNTGVGAEIIGLDLSQPIDEETRRDLYDTWLDAGILLFRGMGTSGPGVHVLCFESVRSGSDGKPHGYDRTPKNRAKTLKVSGEQPPQS